MLISSKQIDSLFTEIRTGKSALLLGQEYFSIDSDFYNNVLKELNIKGQTPSLNEIWKSNASSLENLGNIISDASDNSTYKPWLRAIFSLGWNVVLSSSINNSWIKNSIGDNFGLNIQTKDELSGNIDFYKTFNKKQLRLISLFGDENLIPDKKQLLKLKKQTSILDIVYSQMLSSYGYLIIDGIADDDWFNIDRLLDNIENIPYGCIYIFGMTKKRVEQLCQNDDDWFLFEECINSTHIVLCEKSLKDVIIESGLIEEIVDDQEYEHENEVRISLQGDDCLWITRKDCTQLSNMGITIMRDEILTPLIIDDSNKQEYFADFLQQRDQKSLRYFDIIYKKDRYSFHIPRSVEGLMESAVNNQFKCPNAKREIILLKGNSNSGKTTSLSWFAWHAAKEGLEKRKKEQNRKYVVIYISGNPSRYENEWQEILTEFIKTNINNKLTSKGNRIRNVIVIWDNYNSHSKKTDYVNLYTQLNECNVVLIGSIYLFETINDASPIIQGISFNELKPLKSKLERNAAAQLKSILKMINPEWYDHMDKSEDDYLFENLINFAKFNYSKTWQDVRNLLRSKLFTEAIRTESTSNNLFAKFMERNPESFSDVKETVLSLGIGILAQSTYLKLDDKERQARNEPLINSIQDMNLILAVASQFKKSIELPLSVLLRTISDGKQYRGEYSKLNKILRSDSMVEYENNSSTGSTMVSFRHPSEAIAYLNNNYNIERKEKEISVVLRLIENCRWDIYEEASAVTALVRSFGTNSYGKVDEKDAVRGHYLVYSEYWQEIVDKLNIYASSNPDAMLIAGHFTRDNIEQHPSDNQNDISSLCKVFDQMKNTVEACTIKTSCSRLYGEMCRNLLQQMKMTDNTDKLDELIDDFEYYFRMAVKNGKESSLSNNNFSMIQLLDIWLNYVNHNKDDMEVLLPDTLEYIDSLFYNESNLIDDGADYVNVIENVSKIYTLVNNRSIDDLHKIFKGSNNDSYVYCVVKQILVKVFIEFKTRYPDIFDKKNEQVISSRIFFLNENAANDFNNYHSTHDALKIFSEIKDELRIASKKIIDCLETEYKDISEMSYRCLLVYMRAKWMYYTGNLLLETEQRPAISEQQWSELYKICTTAQVRAEDKDTINRSLIFIQNIYLYTYTTEPVKFHRVSTESPIRLICLYNPAINNNAAQPRLFRISVRPNDHSNKLVAQIDKEVVDGELIKTAIVGRKNIFVPENIKSYREIKRANMNIKKNFVIWFNLGGPQIQDFSPDEEV